MIIWQTGKVVLDTETKFPVFGKAFDQVRDFQFVSTFIERDAFFDRQRHTKSVTLTRHHDLIPTRVSSNLGDKLAVCEIASLDGSTFLHRKHVNVVIPEMIDQHVPQPNIVLQTLVKIGLFKHHSIVNAGRLLTVLVLALKDFGVIQFGTPLNCCTEIVTDRSQIQLVNLATSLSRNPRHQLIIGQPNLRSPVEIVIVSRGLDPFGWSLHRRLKQRFGGQQMLINGVAQMR